MDDLTKCLNEMFYYDREEFQKNAAYHQGEKDGRELGKTEGIEIGKSQGIMIGGKEKQLEIARKMLQKNMSYEEIKDLTELSIEEIKNIEK